MIQGSLHIKNTMPYKTQWRPKESKTLTEQAESNIKAHENAVLGLQQFWLSDFRYTQEQECHVHI